MTHEKKINRLRRNVLALERSKRKLLKEVDAQNAILARLQLESAELYYEIARVEKCVTDAEFEAQMAEDGIPF